MKSKTPNKLWTPEEDERLKSLIETSISLNLVAAKLQRSVSAVKNRAHVLKISVKRTSFGQRGNDKHATTALDAKHQKFHSSRREFKMRTIALFLLCMSSGAAIAQTSECQSIPTANARLACYDKTFPATTPAKPAASKAPTTPQDQQGQIVDRLAVESSRLDARLKTICRGC
jgi:hypothetical protein